MLRRPIVLAVAALAAAALAPAALATVVHVRVEGKTRTIFGAAEPNAFGSTPLQVLESASLGGEFYVHETKASFGTYVDQVARYPGGGQSGWVFKVNGVSPPVGADQVKLKDGDVVLWYYATFGPSGGPPTLELRRKGACYRVFEQDDAGKESPAPGAVLHVDGHTRPASYTGTCIGPHRRPVRATAPGAIRSNELP